MKSECEVKFVASTNNKDLKKALDIYYNEVPANIRTNGNEILQYISGKYNTDKRKMSFYILYCNEIVIGFAEIGILNESKAFFIDYFTLEKQYENNACFYMCFNLMIEDLKKRSPDIKYIIAEYYISKNSDQVDDSFGKKCLALENFKKIDKKYMQPGLRSNEPDSVVECQLLIKETSNTDVLDSLSSQKYISILKDIYYNHYIEWYSHFFNSEELQKYTVGINQLIEKTEKRCLDKVNLKNYTYINCKYYDPSKCQAAINPPFKLPRKPRNALYVAILLLLLVIINLVVYGIYIFFLKFIKLDNDVISIIFPIVTEILILVGGHLAIKLR